MTTARDAAFGLLMKIEKDDAYSTLSVAEASGSQPFADAREQALFTALVYGVLEHRLALDYNISLYLTQPLKKLHPKALCILRLGALQVLYMDKIPASAAVNEAVAMAKRSGAAFAARMVNAVLRKIAQNGAVYPDPSDRDAFLSVRYSCPPWLLAHFTQSYGRERAEKILQAFEGRRPLYLRLNPLRGEDAVVRLAAEGLSLEPTALPHCFAARHTGNIAGLASFAEGLFHVQDLSSQMCCNIVGALPGETVVDCCAAPGGKSFTLAEDMRDEGAVIANDIYPHKIGLIEEGAGRLGITCLRAFCGSAEDLPGRIPAADRVLCDVPCSGLGVIGRKPEIRYKHPEELAALPETQYRILQSCAAMVKPGGTLVYSTCTLNPAENEQVCDRFLADAPAFTVSDDPYYATLRGQDGYVTFFPEPDGGDGFFVAAFKRSAP